MIRPELLNDDVDICRALDAVPCRTKHAEPAEDIVDFSRHLDPENRHRHGDFGIVISLLHADAIAL